MNYVELFKELGKLKTSKEKSGNKFKISKGDLYQDLKFLSLVSPKFTTSETITGFLKGEGTISASDGDTMTKRNLGGLIACAVKLPAGLWIDHGRTQRDCVSLSTQIPLVLYAHKLHKGTPYMKWLNADPLWLGPYYNTLPKGRDMLVSKLRDIKKEEILYNRREAMEAEMANCESPEDESSIMTLYTTSAADEAKNAELPALSELFDDGYIMELRHKFLDEGKRRVATHICKGTGDPFFDRLPRCVRQMVLQTWLFNTEFKTEYMIQNPIDWDKRAPNIDEKIVLADDDSWMELL